jgi:hypothetical protein
MLVPFNPPPGINSDDTTFSAQGRWADGNNVRFRFGRPETTGGQVERLTALSGTICGIALKTAAGDLKVGTTNKLYSRGSSVTTDVTPTPAPSSTIYWSFQLWGSTLLAVPSGGTLYEQSGILPATAIAAAPDQIGVMLVTAQRQVLAFSCNEEASGTLNRLCIRGSDLENYNDWTTSATNNAFEHILDRGDAIMGAKVMPGGVGVWTRDTLYFGQFVGDPGQTYTFDIVANGCGLANPRAVAVMAGYAWWVGTDFALRRWAPGTLPEIVPCPILRDVLENKNEVAASGVLVGAREPSKEIWISYLDNRDEASDNSRYIAYSYGESLAAQTPVWFKGTFGLSAWFDSGLSAETIGGAPATCLVGDTTGTVYWHDVQGFAPPTSYIQSADQYIDNSQRRMMIRGAIPDFDYQSGDVSLTLFTRDRPQSTPVTKGPYVLAASATKKDFRASGKIVAVKFSAESGTYFRLGKPLFDTVATGER